MIMSSHFLFSLSLSLLIIFLFNPKLINFLMNLLMFLMILRIIKILMFLMFLILSSYPYYSQGYFQEALRPFAGILER